MYSLKDFVEYNSQVLKANDIVLAWSKATGYFFIVFELLNESFTIIAVES